MSEEADQYVRITLPEYNRLAATIRHLRKRIQKAREFLETGAVGEAIQILKFEYDTIS